MRQELFDRERPIEMIEEISTATLKAGIPVNIDLIFERRGEPTERAHARSPTAQPSWFLEPQPRHARLLTGSHTMLATTQPFPLAGDEMIAAVRLSGIAA